jgi:hypothetical protein
MGVPASMSNGQVSLNRIQAGDCIVTNGVVTNGSISLNELFPYVGGRGINAKLNGFSVSGNHIDGTPLGGGDGAGTIGVLIQADSFQLSIDGTVFSGIDVEYSILATHPSVEVNTGNYANDNATVVILAPANGTSGWTVPTGAASRTIYFQNPGGVTSVVQRGTTVITNALAGSVITLKLAARDTVTFYWGAGAPTAYAVIER